MSSFPIPATIAWYTKGIRFLEQKNFQEALRAFDTAIELSRALVAVVPSRLVVLEKLQALDDAFGKGRKADLGAFEDRSFESDDLDEETRLFSILARLPEAIQIDLLSLSSNESLQLVIEKSSHLVRDALASRNFIDMMPAEILTLIALQVVQTANRHPKSEYALPLTAVSRRWRDIFLEDKRLWGSVILDGVRGEEGKLDALLPKWELRELSLYYPSLQVVHRLEKQGGKLESLSIVDRPSPRITEIWSALFDASDPPPPLRHLKLIGDGPGDDVDIPADILINLRTFHVDSHSLLLRTTYLPNLQTLHLQLQHLQHPLQTSANPLCLSLPNLSSFIIAGYDPQPFLNVVFKLPDLRAFAIQGEVADDLASCTTPILFPVAPPSTPINNTSKLETLDIINDPQSLLPLSYTQLTLLPSLKKLTISFGWDDDVDASDLDTFARMLTIQTDGSAILLPLLEYLDLDVHVQPSVDVIRALIASRKGRGLKGIRPWGSQKLEDAEVESVFKGDYEFDKDGYMLLE